MVLSADSTKKTGHRHATEIREECMMKQFASACIGVGEDDYCKVHYLNDEYISEIALLPAHKDANIFAK